MPSRSTAKEEDEEKNELVVIVYDLVLVEENFAKHKATDGITITEVDSASGHLSHDDLLDEGEVFYGEMFYSCCHSHHMFIEPRMFNNNKKLNCSLSGLLDRTKTEEAQSHEAPHLRP